MSAHTPSPWEAERGFRDAFSHGSGHYTVEDDFITVWIGDEPEVEHEMAGRNHATVHGPDQQANAAVIAAAPDLLAAAKRVLPYLADLIASSGLASGVGDRLAYDALEAAIAKAERGA